MLLPSSVADLEALFQQRVNQDNARFPFHSVFVPNLYLSRRPRFCLIGMEPSVGGRNLKSSFEDVRNGFKNFLGTEEDFIMHYCAFKFLCHGEYQYHVTDISKGAMVSTIAGEFRQQRYQGWAELLKTELQFLGNPQAVSIGYGVDSYLNNKIGIRTATKVMHYSRNNSGRFRALFLKGGQSDTLNTLHNELREFTEALLTRAKYDKSMMDRVLARKFMSELQPWRKGLYLHYRECFNHIAAQASRGE